MEKDYILKIPITEATKNEIRKVFSRHCYQFPVGFGASCRRNPGYFIDELNSIMREQCWNSEPFEFTVAKKPSRKKKAE